MCGRGRPSRPTGWYASAVAKASTSRSRSPGRVRRSSTPAVSGGTAACCSTFSPRAVRIPVSSVSSMRPAGTRSSRWTRRGRTVSCFMAARTCRSRRRLPTRCWRPAIGETCCCCKTRSTFCPISWKRHTGGEWKSRSIPAPSTISSGSCRWKRSGISF